MTTRMKLTIVLCAVVIGIIAVLLIKPPPLKVRHPVKLETRVFKVDAHLFSTNAVSPKVLSGKLGVDLTAPGRSVAFNDKQGLLLVKATASELDKVERAIQAMNQINPQIHIKVRFVEVPREGIVALPQLFSNAVAGPMTGILNDSQFRTVLQALEHQKGVESLAEPECVTTSGRQTQMRATDIVEILTNFTFKESSSNSTAVAPQTGRFEIGPTMDLVPYVLSDGYTINLTAMPSVIEFMGYEPANSTYATNKAGERIELRTVNPGFRIRSTTIILNLWDNQTIVFGNMTNSFVCITNGVRTAAEPKWFIDEEKQKPNADKELLVLVTATIVDPAGNRVHTDDEMRQIQEKTKSHAPPQPTLPTPSR